METNTFVESTKQNVELKKSICEVHEIAQLTDPRVKNMELENMVKYGLTLGKTSTQPPPVVSLSNTGNLWSS